MRSKLMGQIALCVFSCLASAAQAQEPASAEEIIAKHIEAIGGRAALDACKSMRTTGKMTVTGGREADFVYEVRQPNKFRVEFKPAGSESIVYAGDGQVTWWVMPSGPQQMPEKLARHLKKAVCIGGPLVAHHADGCRVELVGKEEVNDRQAYKLKLIRKESAEGDEEFHFIDAETFLLSRVEGKVTLMGQATEYTKTFSDYRRVDGLMVAFTEKERQRQSGPESVRTIEKVEGNVDLPDERFVMPKPEAIAGEDEPIPVIENDPAGRALYDGMIAAMRAADTLSFKSQYRLKLGRLPGIRCSYHVWLKKPNRFRMEGFRFSQDEPSGILVGDGDHLWIHWPKGCPYLGSEDRGEYDEAGKNAYLTKPTPQGRHSIGHEAGMLGSGIIMTILDLSTFHGYSDSLQPYLDAVAHRGVEPFGDEECDVIEVSYMKAQRTWKIWIARRDRMPRKLEETVRVANTIKAEEIWTDVKINEAIPDEKFAWKPPEGWKEWSRPKPKEKLLKPGTQAPDFELLSTEGKPIKLSDYSGQIVWFYIWRAG
ncbi:MAG: LolA family protein [Planctomycetota bacterium]|jgi:outer membrane lipoprotein-sorting protein